VEDVIKHISSKEMNRLWMKLSREGRSLRDVYFAIRIIHYEKNNDDFSSYFQTNVNEISYKSLLGKTQVKKYINVLIALGFVERFLQKYKTEDGKFTSISNYMVKKLNPELIKRAIKKTDEGAIVSYFKNYRIKEMV